MNEGGVTRAGFSTMSPDSDCNSNQCPPTSVSFLSSTSSQDIDFQDNSEYQWFLDSAYKDGGSIHHQSILSLAESYDANDLHYYNTIAKNMDANLAEADMESFRTEDIHDLLTNLPPICTDHLSQESNHQGECYATISSSMLAKFGGLDSSLSPHSSSQEGEDSTSMSICKSELLFSPIKEAPVLMPGANFSVDSLDCDMMLTCQANKDNYTIAFEGSMMMYSEESNYHETDKSENSERGSGHWPREVKNNQLHRKIENVKLLDASMTQSDSGSLTTWSKLKMRSSENQLRRLPSGNNNNSGDDASHLGLNENYIKSQSMPNLYKQKLLSLIGNSYARSQHSNSSTDTTVKRRPVKVFDIQNHIHSSSVSEMATSVDVSSSENTDNKQSHFSLVKLFMKQKSISTEGMSTTMDQLSSSENWPGSQSGESNCSEAKGALENSRNLEGSGELKIENTRAYDLIAEEPEEDVCNNKAEKSSEITQKPNFQSNLSRNNVNNNNSFEKNDPSLKSFGTLKKDNRKTTLMSRSIQTSNFSEITNLKNANKISGVNSKPEIKIIEPSFLSKLKREGEGSKPVYILYPNYVLPNLDFLNEKNDNTKILLMPQKPPSLAQISKRRPFSFNDIETLKKQDYSHIKDWESLNFLLPPEYRKILSEMPEISKHFKNTSTEKPSFVGNMKHRRRPLSCDYTNLNQVNISSSSSTATQPSSGYRGSSTNLTDSQNSPVPAANLNPLFVYKYDSVTSSASSSATSEMSKPITTMAPPLHKRCFSEECPVLPKLSLSRGILRKGFDPNKRYSMYEVGEQELLDEIAVKRKPQPSPYVFPRNKRFSETEDEGVDAGTSSSSLDEHHETFKVKTPQQNADTLLSAMNNDELLQLEEYLKMSEFSNSDGEELNEESLYRLKSYVSKFLALKINQENSEHFGGKHTITFAEKINTLPKYLDTGQMQFIAPNNSPNSPNVSALHTHNTAEWPAGNKKKANRDLLTIRLDSQPCGILRKKELSCAVVDALEMLANHFETAANQSDQIKLADTSSCPVVGKLLLENLCSVLYALLNDGLKPHIKSEFGNICNSVWQVVEASAQQGPFTKSLHDLVMKINSEDVLTEGTVKFNAFVFGLLNLRSLDAWLSYLRTRESILVKHYESDSFLLMSHTHIGNLEVRELMDFVIEILKPLVIIPFQLDLLFEYRQLQASFMKKNYYCDISPDQTLMGPILKKLLTPESARIRERSKNGTISHNTPTSSSPTHHNLVTLPDLLDSSLNLRNKERPRSCVEPGGYRPNFKLGEDISNIAKKRWSGISSSSRIHQVYERLVREDDEEYSDSLENNTQQDITQAEDLAEDSSVGLIRLSEGGPESLDSNVDEKPINGRRFKKLQQKWEMLSTKESVGASSSTSPVQTPTRSRIPRPVTSPAKPSGIPVFTGKVGCKRVTTPPGKAAISPRSIGGNVKTLPVRKFSTTPANRTSRVDQLDHLQEVTKRIQRPSSLPYKPTTQGSKATKTTPPRRAVSSSLNRKQNKIPKVVRTISHRLPSESGHLSYNEGEKLKVVLEVDEKWLLCCRGTQKGLVPKSAVISADNSCF